MVMLVYRSGYTQSHMVSHAGCTECAVLSARTLMQTLSTGWLKPKQFAVITPRHLWTGHLSSGQWLVLVSSCLCCHRKNRCGWVATEVSQDGSWNDLTVGQFWSTRETTYIHRALRGGQPGDSLNLAFYKSSQMRFNVCGLMLFI